MADTQSNIYGIAFSQNVMQLAKQKASKLMNSVFVRNGITGKRFYQDQIGVWSMTVKAGRNSATPNNDPNLDRRAVDMVDYHDNRLLDRGDELKTISDPRSAYVISAAGSIGNTIDDVIIAAAIGTAYSGEAGGTSNTSGNTVLITAASITMSRLLAVKKALDDYDVEPEDRTFVISTTGMNSLLDLEEATSSDYATIKALVRGEVNSWLGFNWIQTTRLPSGTVGLAYHKNGLCLGMADGPNVRTDVRPDLSYSWQVYYDLSLGATRLEEKRCVWVKEG